MKTSIEKERIENRQVVALLALLLLFMSGVISGWQMDIRYFASGIFLFGIFGWGNLALLVWRLVVEKEKTTLENILGKMILVLSFLLCSSLSILTCYTGTSLFLYHYGVDGPAILLGQFMEYSTNWIH